MIAARANASFYPAFGPGSNLFDDRVEAAAAFGEVVGDADRAVGGDGAGDEALAFELPEALGEEAVGEAGDGGEDLVEAGRAGERGRARSHRASRRPISSIAYWKRGQNGLRPSAGWAWGSAGMGCEAAY